MTNNCPNCDKPGCQAASLDALYQAIDPWRRPADLAHKRGAAIALCGANRVDWRARALTEAARADAAEATLQKARDLASVWIGRAATPFGSEFDDGIHQATTNCGDDLRDIVGEP